MWPPTHSELFDEVLSKVSDYKQPTNESGQLTQGIYALKPDLWKSEFQPLHVMLRGSYKRGYQLAMDKYKGWYQSQNKTKVTVKLVPDNGAIAYWSTGYWRWLNPPFVVPSVFHQFLTLTHSLPNQCPVLTIKRQTAGYYNINIFWLSLEYAERYMHATFCIF